MVQGLTPTPTPPQSQPTTEPPAPCSTQDNATVPHPIISTPTPTSESSVSYTDNEQATPTPHTQDCTGQEEPETTAPKIEKIEVHGETEHAGAEEAGDQARPVSTGYQAAEEPLPSPLRRHPQGMMPL
eukprot:257441-Karenia_brevis.AAC.1